MASKVEVCNMALGALGAPLIASIDDANVGARLCKANFATVADAVMEERPWSFALKRRTYVRSITDPAFGYLYQYPYETDVVRVIEAFVDEPGDIDYAVEGRAVLCDEADGLKMRVTITIPDPVNWSAGFTMAVVYRLGALMAVPLVDSRVLQADQWALYAKQISLAGTLDGMQQRMQTRMPPTRIKNVRY